MAFVGRPSERNQPRQLWRANRENVVVIVIVSLDRLRLLLLVHDRRAECIVR